MFSSKGVVFKPNKNDLDEGKVILFDEEKVKVEKRFSFFKMKPKSNVMLCFVIPVVAFLILSSVAIYFLIAHERNLIYSSKKCLLKDFIANPVCNKDTSCSPVQSVKSIHIVLAQDRNSCCSDSITCSSLLHDEVEHSKNNLKYNYLVSSDFKFLLAFGYDCCTDSTEHGTITMTTTLFINKQESAAKTLSLIFYEEALIIMEVIYEGMKCNENQQNFTMASLCVNGCNISSCRNIFEEEIIRLNISLSDKPTSQSLSSETTTTLQEDMKWLACEDTVKDIPIYRPERWNGLAIESCIHYKPVDHISVEVVKVEKPLYCWENCANFSYTIEDEHDGFKYNFVLGTHGTLFIGGGFRCRTDSQDNSLRIKVLRIFPVQGVVTRDSFLEIVRISEIIEHGIACGNILKNYTISDSCFLDKFGCLPKYEFMDRNIIRVLSSGVKLYKHYDNETDNSGISIPYNAMWISSCHHMEHLSTNLQTDANFKISKDTIVKKSKIWHHNPAFSFDPTTLPIDLENSTTAEKFDGIMHYHYYDSSSSGEEDYSMTNE